MKARSRRTQKKKEEVPRARGADSSETILSAIAEMDLFLTHKIRKLLSSRPTLPAPEPTIQAYHPTRTSVTSV